MQTLLQPLFCPEDPPGEGGPSGRSEAEGYARTDTHQKVGLLRCCLRPWDFRLGPLIWGSVGISRGPSPFLCMLMLR